MSHERKRATISHEQALHIEDDDGDRLVAIKDGNRQWVLLEASNEWKDNHHGVRLNHSDAKALRRFLNEFLAGLEDDDE